VYKISKRFDFEASHQLAGLPEGHQCGRNHGHSYKVIVHLRSDKLDATGFIVDYGKLDKIKDWLKEHFDHRFLNDVVAFNPTAENLAEFLYGLFVQDFTQIVAVTVKETDKTEATFTQGNLTVYTHS